MKSSGQTPADRTAKKIADFVRVSLREDGVPYAQVQRLNDWVSSDRCDSDDPICLCVDVLEHLEDCCQATLKAVLSFLAEEGWPPPTVDDVTDLRAPLLARDWDAVEAWFDRQYPG